MLQEQRAKKITAMAEASKANLEEMMTMMNTLVMAAGGKALPTATTTPPASGNPITVVTKEKQVKAKALSSLCKKYGPTQVEELPQIGREQEETVAGMEIG